MAKVTLTDITSSYSSRDALQANFEALATAMENTVSRDGTIPNQMEADLDMNGNDILNIDTIEVDAITIGGVTAVPSVYVPNWEGPWVTATSYVVNDIVSQDGNTYIAVEAHTSGVFATDLAASKWELFAQKGGSGAGTGDMLAANNLDDLDNADTALANLGGGTVGIAIFKDTTAGAVRTELGLGNVVTKDVTGIDIEAVSGTAGTEGTLGQWNSDGDMVGGPIYETGTITLPATITSHTVDATRSYLNYVKIGRTVKISGSIKFSTISGTIDAQEVILLGESWMPAYAPLSNANNDGVGGGSCGLLDTSANTVYPAGWQSLHVAGNYFGLWVYAPVAAAVTDRWLIDITYETDD